MKTGGAFGGGGRCIDCGAPTANTRCRACYLEQSAPETPLRAYARASGKSLAEIAREHGIPERSARQYASGYGVGGAWGKRAIELSRATGIPLETLLSDTEDAAERREMRRAENQLDLFEEP